MLKLKNIQRKGILYIIALVLIFVPLFNIEAKTDESEKKEKDEPKALKETLDLDKKERKYLYDPAGKTDPFKSFIVVRSKEVEEDSVPKPYLQTVELSQLSVTVIVIGDNDKWAMVKDSKGDAYIIKEGTLVGINGGVVHKIQSGEVVIREEFTNYKGELEIKDVSKKTPFDR